MTISRRTKNNGIEVWDVRFSYYDNNYKRRHYQRRGLRTKKIAEQVELEARSKLNAGDSLITAEGTVGSYLTLWLDRRVFANDLKPSSLAKTKQTVESYLVPRIGDLPLRKLTNERIQNLYVELQKSGRLNRKGRSVALSPKTVRDIAGVLYKALSDGVKLGVIAKNPADGVALPRYERPELNVYDGDETAQFLSYAASVDEYLIALYRLSLLIGLRRGEVLGLRWIDVDFVLNKLSVVQTRITVNGRVIVSTPKTRAGRRTVAIDAGTADELAKLKNKQEQIFGKVPELVATDDDGRPVNPLRYSRHFKRLAIAAGLKAARLHDARHTATTLQLHNGVSAATVRGRLGWSSTSTILDTYSAYLPSADREASDAVAVALDRAIANAKPKTGRTLDAGLHETTRTGRVDEHETQTDKALNTTKQRLTVEATPRIERVVDPANALYLDDFD